MTRVTIYYDHVQSKKNLVSCSELKIEELILTSKLFVSQNTETVSEHLRFMPVLDMLIVTPF